MEREKRVLSRLDHPFFVKLYFTFQDSERLYFGLSVARHGELLSKINLLGKNILILIRLKMLKYFYSSVKGMDSQ